MQDDLQKAAARAQGEALARRHLRVGAVCCAFVVCMVGAAYAAVPLYDWFCRTTGFGGTPLTATAAPATTLDRTVIVTFDANVDPALA